MYRLQEIVDRLLREPTPQSMLDHLHRVLREVHVEHFALLKFSHPGDDVEDWLVGLRAPPKWIEAYQYRDDPSRDPVIAHSRTTIEPFFWSDVLTEERKRRARAMHIPDAIVIPVPGAYGNVGVMWMGGRCREQLAQYKIIIQAIALACYYHLKRHRDPEPDPPTSMLTRREREVLDLVSDGLTAAEIGDFLNLSPRTVEWHVDKAMKKLGAKNRIQAVVLAIRDGLIAP
jgi:DNA-binding CsgD family transcriptional regulator